MATPRHASTERAAWLTPDRRRWLYGILLAAVPLLTVYGVISAETAPLWIAAAAAILGLGTATAHVPGQSSAFQQKNEAPE